MIPTGQDSLNTRTNLTVGEPELRLLFAAEGGGAARRHQPPALLDEGAAGEPAALRGRRDRHSRRPPVHGRLAEGAEHLPRDPVPAGARADAGFHRRSGGGRPRRHARRDEAARRRCAEDQPAGPGPPRHRPQRDGRRVRHSARRSSATSSWNMPATASATNSSSGAAARSTISRSFRRGPASATRSTSSISRAASGRTRTTMARHVAFPDTLGRDRQPHDDGQRPRRARLGRRRDRGGSGDARPAGVDAHPGGRRLPPVGRAQGRHYRHRSGADRHADAPRQGRRRPVRRILRPRPRQHERRRPRDDRQHGARIWRDLRLLPDRRPDARIYAADRPSGRGRRADPRLLPGAGPVARCRERRSRCSPTRSSST